MAFLPKAEKLTSDEKNIISSQRNSDVRLNYAREHPKIFRKEDIEKIKELKYSKNDDERFCYLLLVTGRRVIEIVTGIFKTIPGENNKISFIGQRKSKKNINIGKKFTIVSLDNPKDVVSIINELQEKFNKDLLSRTVVEHGGVKKRPDNQVANLLTIRLTRILKRLLPDQSPAHENTTARDLRKIYAALIMKYKPKNLGDNNWIEMNLGHESLHVSLSYQSVKIV